ncbi:tyrosine-type recombinase/integrase [Rhizobium leguminosarum]
MAGVRGKQNRHLRLKGKTWQFKIGIPAECRAYFQGQQNYVESTGTGDIVTARKWRDRREREMKDLFDDIRSGRLVSDVQARAVLDGQLAREAYRNAREGGSTRFLVVTAAQEQSEALARQPGLQAAFDKAWSGKEDVGVHVETWLKEIDLAPKTTLDYRSILGRFTAWCKAAGHTIADIDRKTAGKYVSSELLDPDQMTRVTAKKHLTAISGYWEHLRVRGHSAHRRGDSPWVGQIPEERSKQGVTDEPERPFTDGELQKLLYLDTPSKRGQPVWEAELKELALISALSGLRIGEIVGLTVDACNGDGFDLSKSKTEAGVRLVPIHSKLVELVARRCEGRTGKALLFAELEGLPNAPDTLSKAFTRRRKALGVHEGRDGKRRSLVNFHSFRRTFATKALHADIPESFIEAVIGHVGDSKGKKSVLRKSYAVKGESWEQRVRCVEAVSVPGPPSAVRA